MFLYIPSIGIGTRTYKICAIRKESDIGKFFSQVVPLLVELLNTNGDTAFAYQALLKVAEVLDSNASLFENYTETFIPKLLKLSRYANQMVRFICTYILIVRALFINTNTY